MRASASFVGFSQDIVISQLVQNTSTDVKVEGGEAEKELWALMPSLKAKIAIKLMAKRFHVAN